MRRDSDEFGSHFVKPHELGDVVEEKDDSATLQVRAWDGHDAWQ